MTLSLIKYLVSMAHFSGMVFITGDTKLTNVAPSGTPELYETCVGVQDIEGFRASKKSGILGWI